MDVAELRKAGGQVGAIVLFGVLPVLVVGFVLLSSLGSSTFLYDFRGDLYDAGTAILHGHDPYRAAFLAHLAAVQRATGSAATTFAVPVYPAPDLLASVPLALLPLSVAGSLFTIASVAALVVGLWLLGVRDWRCLGLAVLSWPVVHSLRLGQINDLLVLGVGVAWRWRERLWPPAIAVALVVVAKLFLWPLMVWLLVTRRWRTAGLAAALGIGFSLVAWAAIGFDGMAGYPRMLSDLSTIEAAAGVSLVSLGHALGFSSTLAGAAGWIVAAVLLGLGWRLGRGPAAARGDGRALGLAVLAGLVTSPLVWPHYLTLVFVPIALLRPRLSALWLVPLLAYLSPVELTHGDVWAILPYLLIEVWVVVALVAPRLRERQPVVVAAAGNPRGAVGSAVRLPHGLRSTSFRSYMAANGRRTGHRAPTKLGRRPQAQDK